MFALTKCPNDIFSPGPHFKLISWPVNPHPDPADSVTVHPEPQENRVLAKNSQGKLSTLTPSANRSRHAPLGCALFPTSSFPGSVGFGSPCSGGAGGRVSVSHPCLLWAQAFVCHSLGLWKPKPLGS